VRFKSDWLLHGCCPRHPPCALGGQDVIPVNLTCDCFTLGATQPAASNENTTADIIPNIVVRISIPPAIQIPVMALQSRNQPISARN
jgi:hypothetical protein